MTDDSIPVHNNFNTLGSLNCLFIGEQMAYYLFLPCISDHLCHHTLPVPTPPHLLHNAEQHQREPPFVFEPIVFQTVYKNIST